MFLRFLDAVFAQRRFASLLDPGSTNFISQATGRSGSAASYLESERSLLGEFGIDLDTAEQRVCLGPGDLLLIDNVAVLHGRIGHRRPRELWHMPFGLEAPSPAIIDRAVQGARPRCLHGLTGRPSA
jgi:hypothetical protein